MKLLNKLFFTIIWLSIIVQSLIIVTVGVLYYQTTNFTTFTNYIQVLIQNGIELPIYWIGCGLFACICALYELIKMFTNE